jgi:hypothetical protein
MGSLNDIVIHPVNGNPVVEDDVGPVNRRLDELCTHIYEATTSMRHNRHRETGPNDGE